MKFRDDSCTVCKFLCYYIPAFKYDFDCIKCGRHFRLPIPSGNSMPETPPDSEVGDANEDKTGDNNETIHFDDFIRQTDKNIERNAGKTKPSDFNIETHCAVCYTLIEDMDFRGLVQCDKCKIWICENCPGYPDRIPSDDESFCCPKCESKRQNKNKEKGLLHLPARNQRNRLPSTDNIKLPSTSKTISDQMTSSKSTNGRNRRPSTESERWKTFQDMEKFRDEASGKKLRNSKKHICCDNDWCTYFTPDDQYAKLRLHRHKITCTKKHQEGKRLRHTPGEWKKTGRYVDIKTHKYAHEQPDIKTEKLLDENDTEFKDKPDKKSDSDSENESLANLKRKNISESIPKVVTGALKSNNTASLSRDYSENKTTEPIPKKRKYTTRTKAEREQRKKELAKGNGVDMCPNEWCTYSIKRTDTSMYNIKRHVITCLRNYQLGKRLSHTNDGLVDGRTGNRYLSIEENGIALDKSIPVVKTERIDH